MRYGVYQIPLAEPVNNKLYTAWRESLMGNVKPGLADNLYVKVAEIEANDLDEVFEIGNIGPEEHITRLQGMSSVSVGNIIEDAAGKRFVVANFGFKELA